MFRDSLRAILRIGVAVAVVAAIAAQMQNLHDRDLLIPSNFFSFFTVQSNVLAAAVLIGLEVAPSTWLGRFARWARGGVTLYMTMTGLIYAVLLAPIAADVSTQLAWVNAVLHIVAPIVMLIDWIAWPPDPVPTVRASLMWLGFPIAWIGYSFIRGAIVDWYPYPFLDPREDVEHAAGDWPTIIVTIVVLTVFVTGLALAIRWIAAWRSDGTEGG